MIVVAVRAPATGIEPSAGAMFTSAADRSGPPAFQPMVTCVAFPLDNDAPGGRVTTATGCCTTTGNVTRLPSLRLRII